MDNGQHNKIVLYYLVVVLSCCCAVSVRLSAGAGLAGLLSAVSCAVSIGLYYTIAGAVQGLYIAKMGLLGLYRGGSGLHRRRLPAVDRRK